MPKGIHQLPSGSWRVRWTEPDGSRRSRIFATAEDAITFQDGIRPALMRGQPVAKIRSSGLFEETYLRVPARGHYCYLLHADDDTIVYVGRSSNIIKRLGDHLHVKGRRAVVAYVSIIECIDVDEMKQLETALIYKHQPALNTRGLLGRPRRKRRNGQRSSATTLSLSIHSP